MDPRCTHARLLKLGATVTEYLYSAEVLNCQKQRMVFLTKRRRVQKTSLIHYVIRLTSRLGFLRTQCNQCEASAIMDKCFLRYYSVTSGNCISTAMNFQWELSCHHQLCD